MIHHRFYDLAQWKATPIPTPAKALPLRKAGRGDMLASTPNVRREKAWLTFSGYEALGVLEPDGRA